MNATLRRVLIALSWFGCQTEPPPLTDPLPGAAATSEAVGGLSTDPTTEQHRKRIFADLRARVDALGEAGTYDCCIKTPCSHCALMAGGCRCGEGLRRGEPVCEECALMWSKGLGDEPGVDPAGVRSFLEASRGAQGCDCGAPGAAP